MTSILIFHVNALTLARIIRSIPEIKYLRETFHATSRKCIQHRDIHQFEFYPDLRSVSNDRFKDTRNRHKSINWVIAMRMLPDIAQRNLHANIRNIILRTYNNIYDRTIRLFMNRTIDA